MTRYHLDPIPIVFVKGLLKKWCCLIILYSFWSTTSTPYTIVLRCPFAAVKCAWPMLLPEINTELHSYQHSLGLIQLVYWHSHHKCINIKKWLNSNSAMEGQTYWVKDTNSDNLPHLKNNGLVLVIQKWHIFKHPGVQYLHATLMTVPITILKCMTRQLKMWTPLWVYSQTFWRLGFNSFALCQKTFFVRWKHSWHYAIQRHSDSLDTEFSLFLQFIWLSSQDKFL